MANLSFLSWLRRGLGTGIQTAAAGAGATEIALQVASNAQPNTVPVSVPVVGPGDIAGVDPRIVVRVTPGRNESDAESDLFAAIELDQPDLPWRYSPIAAPTSGGPDQISPWLALVVLEDSEISARVESAPDRKLATITVTTAMSLPDLTDSWAWAHVQTIGAPDPISVGTAISGSPGQVVARIVCPRVLRKQTAYGAYLVPTFERGRRAGTGEKLGPSIPPEPGDPPAEITAGAPAWTPVAAAITLPIYYEWRFITGAFGGFQDLVRRVKPSLLSDKVGRRPLDVSVPGYNLPSAVPPTNPPTVPTPTALPVEGALQSVSASRLARPPVADAFVTALRTFESTRTLSVNGNPPEPVVVPPLYGQWPASITDLGLPPAPPPPPPALPPWELDLNTDPRDRVAAGLGTLVVQAHQEALLAGAWAQVGNLRTVNDTRRIVQTGREVFTRAFNRHATTGRLDSVLALTGSLFGQLHASSGTGTVFAQVSAGPAGFDLFEPQWRRLSAARGPIGRRLGFLTTPPTGAGPIERMNAKTFNPAPEPPTPAGMATPADAFASVVPGGLTPPQVTTLAGRGADPLVFWGILFFCVARKLLLGPASPNWSYWWLLRMMRFGLELIRLGGGRGTTDFRVALRDFTLTPALVQSAPKLPGFAAADDVPTTLGTPPAPGTSDSGDAGRFRTALIDLFTNLNLPRLPAPNPTALDLAALRGQLATQLHPGVTLSARISSLITLFGVTWLSTDPLEPFLIGPEFTQGMWAPLRDRSQEWIVPGLAEVGTDTVGVLVPNQRFIEAYMVGLNHEMARELLWNEYPSDQRATAFRQFWDNRGYVMTDADLLKPPDVFAESTRDIRPINQWLRTNHLGTNSPRVPAPGSTAVLLVRAELVHRYPNVVVYAVPAASGGIPEPPVGEIFPVFSGRLGLDSGYYGFNLTVSQALGTNPAWFFVLQEHPTEPHFHLPPGVSVGEGHFLRPSDLAGGTSAAAFALQTYRRLTRVGVPAAILVPPET